MQRRTGHICTCARLPPAPPPPLPPPPATLGSLKPRIASSSPVWYCRGMEILSTWGERARGGTSTRHRCVSQSRVRRTGAPPSPVEFRMLKAAIKLHLDGRGFSPPDESGAKKHAGPATCYPPRSAGHDRFAWTLNGTHNAACVSLEACVLKLVKKRSPVGPAEPLASRTRDARHEAA